MGLLTWKLALVMSMAHVGGGDWPQFRGPAGDGHAPQATGLPTTWSETENVAWKVAVPGRGWSSPVIGDGLVWLTTAVEEPLPADQVEAVRARKLAFNPQAKDLSLIAAVTLRAAAVDVATGALKHDLELIRAVEPPPIHSYNSFASPTPILNDGRLYCHFGTFGTVCVDAATGQILWKTQLPTEHSVGPGSSPVLFENRLIIPCDGTEAQAIVALDTANGSIAWKTKRPKMTGFVGEFHKAFSTPLLTQVDGRDQAVVAGAQWISSYDPLSGTELWRYRHGDGFSNVPRPVIGNGMVYFCTGYMQHSLAAIPADGRGDISQSTSGWRVKRQVPAIPSPVLVGDALYLVSDQGIASCVDALTGDQRWQQRIEGNYAASLLFADGKLFATSREGRTTLFAPEKTYRELAVNQLDGQFMASPAALPGALFLRSATHLYRLAANGGR